MSKYVLIACYEERENIYEQVVICTIILPEFYTAI